MIAVILGLPGCGKTRVGIELAAALLRRGRSSLVLHTDLLKVTRRLLDPAMPPGPAWQADLDEKLSRIRPLLVAHADKAEQDGYDLVVEGTLAIGFVHRSAVRFLLEVEEEERRRRVRIKHAAAARALTTAELSDYSSALAQDTLSDVHRLDASGTVPNVVASVLGWLGVE